MHSLNIQDHKYTEEYGFQLCMLHEHHKLQDKGLHNDCLYKLCPLDTLSWLYTQAYTQHMDSQYNQEYRYKKLLLFVQSIEHLFHREKDYMVAPLLLVLVLLKRIFDNVIIIIRTLLLEGL